MRLAMYRLQFMLEAAAVITTRFTTCAAAGMPTARKTLTKGLAVMLDPGWMVVHGTMATRTVIAPM